MKIRKVRKRSALVTNKGDSSAFQSVTTNFRPHFRWEKYEGRDHMVVPMVMLVEGVHAGSNGPLLYNNEEIGKTPEVWNHKPVVVHHPVVNGKSISACDPTVLKTYKVGVVFNTHYVGNRLKAEAWLDPERLKKVDDRVLNAIKAKKIMEISTGLFSDFEDVEGDWNGEKYVGVVRNMRPDHLAILPDQKGACSVADGAGLLRNTKKPKEGKETDVRKKLIDALISNEKTEWAEEDREFLTNVEEVRFEKIVKNGGKIIEPPKKVDDDPTTNDGDPIKVKKITKKEPEAITTNTPKAPEPKKPQTAQEIISTLSETSPEIAQMLGHGLKAYGERKALMVEAITANEKNTFTKEQLEAMDVENLEAIVALLPTTNVNPAPAKPSYSGLADAFFSHKPPVVNVHGGPNHEEEPLENIVMNFSSAK